MKHLAPLLLLLCVGCLQPQTGKVGDSTSTAAGAVSARELGEALARHVEASDKAWSQHVYRVAETAAHDAGVTVELGETPKNELLDDSGKAEWAKRFRSWK